MPKMDGWQVCREIRKYSKVPIIMLTAKGDERDELQGFDLGVDEYITKPFSPKILVARVEAILRRSNLLTNDDVISAGGIELDKAAHQVKICLLYTSYCWQERRFYYLSRQPVKCFSI